VVGRRGKSACEGNTGAAHAVGTVVAAAVAVAVAVDLTYETC
jgi:hypothetical protein